MQNLRPTDSAGSVTDAERAYAIDALKTTQASLHQSLAGLSEDQLTYKPNPDRWSIAECMEHIALIEMGIFQAIQKGMTYPADPTRRAEIKLSDIDVVKAVRSRMVTLPSPEAFVPTGRFGRTTNALQAFDTQREATIARLETITEDLRTHYFRHIAFGWLDLYQTFLLMAAHGERHRKQIEEVKNSPDFPQ